MDASGILSVVAITISVIALLASSVFAVQQLRMAHKANHLTVVTELIREYRSENFYSDLVFVTTRLRAEHEPEVGISGLPDSARAAVVNIAFFYQSVAWLIELGILRRPVLGLMSERITSVWPAIQPFVEVERERVPGPLFQLLERTHHTAHRHRRSGLMSTGVAAEAGPGGPVVADRSGWGSG